MKPKKRLNDLSYEEREQFYVFMNENKNDKNILKLIEEKFCIRYNKSSKNYVKLMANLEDTRKKLEQDNEVMKSWGVEDKVNSPNYAEILGDLLCDMITSEEFEEMTASISFDSNVLSET